MTLYLRCSQEYWLLGRATTQYKDESTFSDGKKNYLSNVVVPKFTGLLGRSRILMVKACSSILVVPRQRKWIPVTTNSIEL